jgi:hypothetical protein
VHVDRAAELREDGTLERLEGAERAAELVRETWRRFEEFQLSPAWRWRRSSSSSAERSPGRWERRRETVAFGPHRPGDHAGRLRAPGRSAGATGRSAGASRTTTSRFLRSRRALELGINWVDTAAQYGLGHSEEVVRRAVEGVERAR